MKHLLNDLSQSEKNRILEQYNNSLTVDTSKFKKLLESKLGNVKPLLTEDDSSTPFGNFKCVTNTIDIGSKLWPKKSEHHPGKFYMREFRDGSGKSQYTMTNGGMKIVYYDSGSYYIEKSDGSLQPSGKKDFYRFYCQGDTIKRTTEIVTIDGPPKPPPFKDNVDGNKFRKWVNQNYPKIAKDPSVDLSETGVQADSYKNSYITKAWNYKVGDKTLGELYTLSTTTLPGVNWLSDMYKDKSGSDPVNQSTSKNNLKSKYDKFSEAEFDPFGFKASQKRDIELSDPNSVPQIFKGAGGERINKEVYYIKINNKNKNKPFLVVDPRMNIVAAFTADYKLIDYSQTVKGADAQSFKPHTYEDWCRDTGKYGSTGPTVYYRKNCILKGKEEELDNLLINYDKDVASLGKNKANSNWEKNKSKVVVKLDYGALAPAKGRSASPGVYKGGGLTYHNYLGNPNLPNTISLQTMEGETLPTAIHALVNQGDRINLDTNLKTFLQKEKEFGRIPDQYKNQVESLIQQKSYGLSSGCFNVDPKFIQNPDVLSILKLSPYIFVMSQDEDFYLVKLDSEQGTKFFNEIGGDGEFCKNPTSVATQIGGGFTDVRNA